MKNFMTTHTLTVLTLTLATCLSASDSGTLSNSCVACGSVVEPTLVQPPVAPTPESATDSRVECGTCKAMWDGKRYVITAVCESKDCTCDIPATTAASTPTTGDEGRFECYKKGENATAERFFLNLCGKGTGIHYLRFDKSQVEMFTGYELAIKENGNVVWEISGKWVPNDYKTVPENDVNSIDASLPSSVVLRCDSDKLGDMAQTVTLAADKTVKFQFGAWKVDVKYLGK